jgi:hypothetical protein
MICVCLFWVATPLIAQSADAFPVRGIHLNAPQPADVPLLLRFITEAMPREGANTLVLEVNYRYEYTRRPEVRDAQPLTREQVQAIGGAARKAGVRIVPMINLLGHQSWAKTTFGLLRSHPEFDETPGKYPGNEGIYCRSYCPRHPEIHAVVFDLIDELMEVFEADTFHAGLDEVFLLGDENCPRCRGHLPADLFAAEVTAIRDHLARSNRRLWIWGDRLLDGAATGTGKWEGSYNGTWPAIHRIPKDVLICDWHYEEAVPGAAFFAMHGFDVVSSPWRKSAVALAQIDMQRSLRTQAHRALRERARGFLQTTWTDAGKFLRAYFGEQTAEAEAAAREAAQCFRTAYAHLRQNGLTTSSTPSP